MWLSMSIKNNNKEKNFFKNYVILIIVFILFGCFVWYLCRCYNVYNDYKKEIPVIRGTLSEIGYEDLDHYVVDVPNSVIYICISSDDNCRSFEKKLKKYVNYSEMNDKIVYLNLNGIDKDDFVNDFNDKYVFKTKLKNGFPAFVIFRDGKINGILQSKNEELKITKVDNFLELNDINEEE